MTKYDVDLRDYWRVIKKRQSIIVTIAVLIVICSYGFAKIKEPRPLYKASAAIKIDRRSDIANGGWLPPENMPTHAYTVTSYPVIVQAAKLLKEIPEDVSEAEVRTSTAYFSKVQEIKSTITSEQQPGTKIINVTVIARDKERAARIANAVLRAYQMYDAAQKNKKNTETKLFIKKQLALTQDQLKNAAATLQSFKERHAIFSIDDQTKELLDRMATVRQKQEELLEEKKQVEKLLKLFGGRETPDSNNVTELLFPGGQKDALFPNLQERFESLRLTKRELLSHYTEEHPQVKSIDGNITAVIKEAGKQLQTRLEYLSQKATELAEKKSQLLQEINKLPENAEKLAKLQRQVDLKNELYGQLQEKYQDVLIQGSGANEEIDILKPAIPPLTPFNVPSKILIVFSGLILGLIVGVIGAFGIEVFDTSMGTIEDVEALLNVPVLGVIPSLSHEKQDGDEELSSDIDRGEDSASLIVHYDPTSLASEAFRTLRTNIQFLRLENKKKLFMLTSAYLQEGKTLNIVNLSLALAQNGEKVLLVESDLRRSTLHKIFGLEREPGLTDFILGNYQIDEIKNNISDVMLGKFEIEDILKTPGLDNLHIITAGTKPPNPSEILSSERFKQFIQAVYPDYDFILIDVPPILPVADANQVASLVDGVVMVYTVGQIGRGVLKRAKDMLETVGANVVGVVLNKVKPDVGPDYFKYHTKYYNANETDDISADKTPFMQRPDTQKMIASITSLLETNKTVLGAIALVVILLAIGLIWNLS